MQTCKNSTEVTFISYHYDLSSEFNGDLPIYYVVVADVRLEVELNREPVQSIRRSTFKEEISGSLNQLH